MTENEIISELKEKIKEIERITNNFLDVPMNELRKANKEIKMCNISISSLEEIQQYRAIGTVDEIKEILQIVSEGQDDVDESGISMGLLHTLLEYAEYKKIGTVEECREAREKQRGRKVNNRKLLRDFNKTPYSVRGDCPNCGSVGLLSMNTDYCNACGQKLDWSE